MTDMATMNVIAAKQLADNGHRLWVGAGRGRELVYMWARR
jgi:hypothetical protein